MGGTTDRRREHQVYASERTIRHSDRLGNREVISAEKANELLEHRRQTALAQRVREVVTKDPQFVFQDLVKLGPLLEFLGVFEQEDRESLKELQTISDRACRCDDSRKGRMAKQGSELR